MSGLRTYRVHWVGCSWENKTEHGALDVRAFSAEDAKTQALIEVRLKGLPNWVGVSRIEPLEEALP